MIPDAPENDGRCPNCGEDEMYTGRCYYCGWPKDDDEPTPAPQQEESSRHVD